MTDSYLPTTAGTDLVAQLRDCSTVRNWGEADLQRCRAADEIAALRAENAGLRLDREELKHDIYKAQDDAYANGRSDQWGDDKALIVDQRAQIEALTGENKRLNADYFALRVEVDALRLDGPRIHRGVDGAGNEVFGTMREVLGDYMQAADAEARLGDEARAEVEALKQDAARLDWLAANRYQYRIFYAIEPADSADLIISPRSAIDAFMQPGQDTLPVGSGQEGTNADPGVVGV